jgi:hypothetical protein
MVIVKERCKYWKHQNSRLLTFAEHCFFDHVPRSCQNKQTNEPMITCHSGLETISKQLDLSLTRGSESNENRIDSGSDSILPSDRETIPGLMRWEEPMLLQY